MRFVGFTEQELAVMRDGLLGEAEIDPEEDSSFPAIMATAEALIEEIDAEVASR